MTITFDRSEEVIVIKLKGDIDMEEILQIKNLVSAMVRNKCYQLVLDFSKVHHLNSSGIGILADTIKRLHVSKGDLRLAQLNPYLHNIFELTNTTRFFKIYNKCQEAVGSYKNLNYTAV